MTHAFQAAWAVAYYLFHRLSIFLIAGAAVGVAGYSIACVVGAAPWLDLTLQFGVTSVPNAGQIVQIGMSVALMTLLFFLPSHARMMALETSHRNFHVSMRDVARAYAAAHKADREGAFQIASEFDSVRDRIAFLRAHPDLDLLEADVMELAAQMSHLSRELAQTYSDANVARARDFLVQRQEDLAEFEDRIKLAKSVADDLTRWHKRVELEESVAQSRLDQLRRELADILPELSALPASPALPEEVAQERTAQDPAAESEPDHGSDDRIVALLARRAER